MWHISCWHQMLQQLANGEAQRRRRPGSYLCQPDHPPTWPAPSATQITQWPAQAGGCMWGWVGGHGVSKNRLRV